MLFSFSPNRTGFGASAPETRSDSRGRLGKPATAALLAVSLLTTACTTRSELGFATLMNEVPATRAIIVPPPGGPSIVAVLERKYQNGVSQEIALSTASLTPGQNAFYVSLATGGAPPQSQVDDVLSLPSSVMMQERVQEEMEERLPGIDMQTSLVYVQNKYGPFGFATGRSASGDVCLYAWQRIEPNKPAVFVPGGVISIRLRLCDAAATQQQLLRTMYAFTISAYYMSGSWNPYGDPPRVPAHLGEIDAPIYPLGINDAPATVVRERRVRVQAEPSTRLIDKDTVIPAAPVQPTTPTYQQPTASPQTGYPVVPPPPSQ
ncbi:cellulose biosynthesis protein BcsN [Microvirga guangxiensis]|uniref:Cellulose biosynthesis protein BcsN n=1 Tax=Microvirga guangxiensis TaxID=549386 RepID=A0A1G5GWN9_9HYPH|nr:cellulose biosynthesis protein BcsN [Microvirga guangxiensis]SCY55993.1 Cellulose biosynthesis protein BcsN [Microvirga guangxiensis]